MALSMDRKQHVEKFNGEIPTVEELYDRFYDINEVISIDVDYRGYLSELDAIAPFHGIASVRTIINLLNKDINVIVKDSDLIKLRNSIVFYNEYFCPSEDNVEGYQPALMAFDRIEGKYELFIGKEYVDLVSNNPFLTRVLAEIDDSFYSDTYNDHSSDDIDDAMDRYIQEKRKNDSNIRSKFKGEVKKEERMKTLHEIFSENIHDPIDFEQYEKCYEDCILL